MNDRIEKRIELKAPIARVWQALTDHRQFGEWFRVRIEQPFVVGKVSRGEVLYPGFEHVLWEALIEKMEPEKLFSWTWAHPRTLEKAAYKPDYTGEPTTLVEFRLEKTPSGTLLTLTESGFDKLPADRREERYRGNEGGWTRQMENIRNYVEQPS
jgi:uncharacterized protein YndB with AHSA1/START domain